MAGAERMGEQGGGRGRSWWPPQAPQLYGDGMGATALCTGNGRWGFAFPQAQSRGQGAGRLGGNVSVMGCGMVERGERKWGAESHCVEGDVISRNLRDSCGLCAPLASPGADVPTPGVSPGCHPRTAHGGGDPALSVTRPTGTRSCGGGVADDCRIRSQSLFTNGKELLDGGCKCLEIAELVAAGHVPVSSLCGRPARTHPP